MRYFIYVAFITMADVNDVKVRSEIQVGIFDNGNYFSMWTQKLHAINMSIIKALALMLGGCLKTSRENSANTMTIHIC